MTNYLLSNLDVVGVKPWQTARSNGALPAAGAFDGSPIEMYCSGMKTVTLYCSYLRGLAGGEVTLQIQSSPHAEDTAGANWFTITLYDADDVAVGADSLSQFQREHIQYSATGATAESFTFGPIHIDGDVQRLRVVAAESGQVGNPGSLEVIAKFA